MSGREICVYFVRLQMLANLEALAAIQYYLQGIYVKIE